MGRLSQNGFIAIAVAVAHFLREKHVDCGFGVFHRMVKTTTDECF